MDNKRRNLASPGFTLVELLVAVSLLSLVAVLSWRALASITNTREQLTVALDGIAGLQAGFAQCQIDAANVLAPDENDGRPTVQASIDRLSLLRTQIERGRPSRLLAVSYSLENGALVRRVADASPADDPSARKAVLPGAAVVLQPAASILSLMAKGMPYSGSWLISPSTAARRSCS